MTHRRILASLCALAGSLAIGACSSDSSLRVTNNSDFSITELYLTQVDNPDFGPNLLGSSPLDPDQAITISVSCDTYDAQLFDETNEECDLHGIDLCLNSADWVITNDTCASFSNARKKRLEAAQAAAQAQAPAQAQ